MYNVTFDTNMKSSVWSRLVLSVMSDFELSSSRSLIFHTLIFFLRYECKLSHLDLRTSLDVQSDGATGRQYTGITTYMYQYSIVTYASTFFSEIQAFEI